MMSSFNSLTVVGFLITSVTAEISLSTVKLTHAGSHPRDLAKRGRDCGTFTLYCGGAPESGGTGRLGSIEQACTNACYFINELGTGSYIATYQSTTSPDVERVESGCRAANGNNEGVSVCNSMPFSQAYHDWAEQIPNGVPVYGCDEFPMANMYQNPFQPGTVRNSLRCIDISHNSRAGNQYRDFVAGQGIYAPGQGSGRNDECEGHLQDGDTFGIGFDFNGSPNLDQIGWCKDSNGNPVGNLGDDHHQFHLTSKATANGKIDFEYQPQQNNRYASGDSQRDLLQCKINIVKTGDAQWQAFVQDGNWNSWNPVLQNLDEDGQSFVIDGENGYQNILIKRLGPIGEEGSDGYSVLIQYGQQSDPYNYFTMLTNSIGNDNTLYNMNNNDEGSNTVVLEGGYSKWTKVEMNGNGLLEQTITSYFPCLSPT